MTDEEGGVTDGTSDDATEPERGVVLDVLPNGRPDDDRPAHRKPMLAYVLVESDFQVLECTLEEDADVAIVDRIPIGEDAPAIQRTRELEFADLSGGAQSELEYAVEAIVEREEDRFVAFYTEAQPITLRLHQLDLLPGIGDTLRNNVLDERKRGPFEDFADLEDRVSGLHSPREVIVERIVAELQEEDVKYRAFVGHETE